jgi:hypothetical protein
MEELKSGDKIKIGPRGNNTFVEHYSHYVGWQGTYVRDLDEDYALVDLPDRSRIEHKPSNIKVPKSQLIKL